MYLMNSITAAKRRRAGIQPSTPQTAAPVQTAPSPQPTQQKMNIVQYLASLEKRVVTLETQKTAVKTEDESLDNIQVEIETPEGKTHIPIVTFMESMDARFQMLVEEIATMKDTVMKLQTFTMEVNQKLLHELTNINVNETQEVLEPLLEQVEPTTLSLEIETNDVSNNAIHEEMLEDISGNTENDDIQIGYRQDHKKKRKNK